VKTKHCLFDYFFTIWCLVLYWILLLLLKIFHQKK